MRNAYKLAVVNKTEALRDPCGFPPKQKLDRLMFENEEIKIYKYKYIFYINNSNISYFNIIN